MSDLISRSNLYNKLVELETLARNRVLDTPTNSPSYQRYVSQMNERTMFKELVADMATAYDVDKVVAELEEEREYSYADFEGYVAKKGLCLDAEYEDWFCKGLERAKVIVRKGGVE